jgi:hypothetical protein
MGCPKNSIRAGLLTPWELNGSYDFKRLLEDRTIPESCISEDMDGYFRLFCGYYKKTDDQLRRHGLTVPGEENDLLLTNECCVG